jgi:hypothetical protein
MTDNNYKIDNADRHIYLYAKGHYKRSENILDDLRVIVGERAGVPSDCVSLPGIFIFLENIASKIYDREYGKGTGRAISRYNDTIMLTSVSDSNMTQITETLINALLSVIAQSKMVCAEWKIDLGEPSSGILPVNNKESK